MCLEHFVLHHCHCFSRPGLSWDTILKMVRAKLNFIYRILFQKMICINLLKKVQKED